MYLTLAEVVASDADCLIRNCDFPAMQDNPIRLTMFPLSSPETQEEEIRWMTNGLRLALEKDKSHYRKACADDRSPVGFAGWSLLNSSLTIVAVNPAYQRQGVGTMLLKWACDEADRNGRDGFLLASTAGVRLYEKFGFEKVGEVRTAKGPLHSMFRKAQN
ncbi:Acyl-CoA N-acyltransferase [Penicillium expansum]|uniref:Acyl-CoA N-acyltransferase n=1 Tax=Penicillium expansum TaxID=27334 RepID=A0A0A2JX56_PENEN|nr:Acyl-CoA N-acyltransferase [Penicillium expansum]KGO56770.1 Acyl-CoA N-acyltransferase [Penicillium expansum]